MAAGGGVLPARWGMGLAGGGSSRPGATAPRAAFPGRDGRRGQVPSLSPGKCATAAAGAA